MEAPRKKRHACVVTSWIIDERAATCGSVSWQDERDASDIAHTAVLRLSVCRVRRQVTDAEVSLLNEDLVCACVFIPISI